MGKRTVRAIGAGAGNMTYVLLAEAGHFVGIAFPDLLLGSLTRIV